MRIAAIGECRSVIRLDERGACLRKDGGGRSPDQDVCQGSSEADIGQPRLPVAEPTMQEERQRQEQRYDTACRRGTPSATARLYPPCSNTDYG